MLDEADSKGLSHIVSWLPEAYSFKIQIENTIVDVFKQYFNLNRYKSFARQHQIYGFARTCRGGRKGECRHPLFLRGMRHLLTRRAITGNDFHVAPTVLAKSVAGQVCCASKIKMCAQGAKHAFILPDRKESYSLVSGGDFDEFATTTPTGI